MVMYRLAGTGARPDSRGYYQIVKLNKRGQWGKLVSEGETPYEAIDRAGLYPKWDNVPSPSWAFISIRKEFPA